MSKSWYVESNCVDIKELQPLSLVFIGVVIQTLISAIILSRETETHSNSNDATVPLAGSVNLSSPKKPHNSCYQRCIKWAKYLLLLWQFVSVILVLILDIIKMMDKAPAIQTEWNRYQCLLSILLTSSNAKTLLSYAFLVSTLELGLSPSKIFKGMKDLYPQTSNAKILFLTISSLLGIVEICILTPYGLGGVIAYIWIPLVVEVVLMVLIVVLLKVTRTTECMMEWVENTKMQEQLFMNMFSLTVVLLALIFGLSAVNLFSGINYMESWCMAGHV